MQRTIDINAHNIIWGRSPCPLLFCTIYHRGGVREEQSSKAATWKHGATFYVHCTAHCAVHSFCWFCFKTMNLFMHRYTISIQFLNAQQQKEKKKKIPCLFVLLIKGINLVSISLHLRLLLLQMPVQWWWEDAIWIIVYVLQSKHKV